jgi:hypothetical protein
MKGPVTDRSKVNAQISAPSSPTWIIFSSIAISTSTIHSPPKATCSYAGKKGGATRVCFTRGSSKKLALEATLVKDVGNLAATRTVLRDKLPSVRAPFFVFYFSPLVGARAMTGFATLLVSMESRDGAMSLTGDALSVLIIRIVPGPMGSLDLGRLPTRFLVEIKSGKMN